MNPYIKEYAELVKAYEAKKGKERLFLHIVSDRLKRLVICMPRSSRRCIQLSSCRVYRLDVADCR